MKIIPKIDLIKNKYKYLEFPVIISKETLIVKKISGCSCLVRDKNNKFSRSKKVECSGIICSRCFFCRADIEYVENYINILKIK